MYPENSYYFDINKNIISYFNLMEKYEASLISDTFWKTVRGQVAAKDRAG